MISRLPKDQTLEMEDRCKIKKIYSPPVPHLLQTRQDLALLYAKVAGCPGTGSYPAPSPSPTTQTNRFIFGHGVLIYYLLYRFIKHEKACRYPVILASLAFITHFYMTMCTYSDTKVVKNGTSCSSLGTHRARTGRPSVRIM